MYLGRIVTKSKKLNVIDLIEKTESSDGIDGSVPTLIVGKKLAESLYGKDKVKILDKKICDNVYWTFMKTEKREEFEVDLKEFQDNILRGIFSYLKYTFIPILLFGYNRIKSMLSFISSNTPKIFYFTDKHVYIYYGTDSVIGFSLKDTEYIGIKREKLISRIRTITPNSVILQDKDFLSREMLRFIDQNEIVIPYLYFVLKYKK